MDLLSNDSLNSRIKTADTTITDTSFKIPARLINDSIVGLIIFVLPYNGPILKSVRAPNMKGNGPGYMWAINTTTAEGGPSVYLILFTSGPLSKKIAINNYAILSSKEILDLLIYNTKNIVIP